MQEMSLLLMYYGNSKKKSTNGKYSVTGHYCFPW